MREVAVRPIPLNRLEALVGPQRGEQLATLAESTRAQLGGARVWNLNSTATGGGVAEMLRVLVAYALGAGIETRWLVLDGDPGFFAITKRLHNRIHGTAGDGGPLGPAERRHYDGVLAGNLDALRRLIRPGDRVILHDPQTAGLAPELAAPGTPVIWRCHVGLDHANEHTAVAWAFLQPYLAAVDTLVFSRGAYPPDWADPGKVTVIPPAIDPFSVKNQDMGHSTIHAILAAAGLLDGQPRAEPAFRRGDGSHGLVRRPAVVVRDGQPPPPSTPMVVQVSRWDRLKDMPGVLRGFAEHVLRGPAGDAHLALVGPSDAGVADDPEGRQVLDECEAAWRALPAEQRRRVTLASLPMDDLEENAAMVNAVVRHAAVVVQKSLAEGFGLTVTEAMWKARPVVASAVGGIQDQIVDGEHGRLLRDPTDLGAFGDAVAELLTGRDRAERLGHAAQERVRERFLPDRQLTQWGQLLTRSLG